MLDDVVLYYRFKSMLHSIISCYIHCIILYYIVLNCIISLHIVLCYIISYLMNISTIELHIIDTHIYAFLYAPQYLYIYAHISEIDKVRYRRSIRQGKMK